jgi:hypothetical protein
MALRANKYAPVSTKTTNNARKITGIGLGEGLHLARCFGAAVNLPAGGNGS